ncbi:hypothetical protein MNEG_13355 [Monoraphidium neglectum]|jgi:hypothetical protein|uniref:Uncharacterized protein n=1 Tax=Monoraphidium neglectum TaxID=145388 RepID=A0A0D2KFF2_9CHLO|nr:hypothetical protein MNEG_13355 [Monoraphidium neglectum]KIY94608.1 hypothetical protein MNEG_13355 [Monoraphidium neglectum]|eukprot:XP_013893628.1 hypothetical protein MNEG_13355 [Monoraphidium neglectum]
MAAAANLANMIADASVEKFKEECDKNVCTVSINLHNRHEYDITVMPMAIHVVLSYKTLQYKVPRADKETYTDTIDFLAEAIDNACRGNLHADVEFDRYRPDSEESHYYCCLRVHRHGAQVFYREFERDDMQRELKRYMRTLRLLN